MIWLILSLLLGILPQSLYFMLFITNIKEIRNKRFLFLIIISIILSLLVLIVQYNIYLYLTIIPLIYRIMKALYGKKTQIIDIFIISASYGLLSLISYLCSNIYKNNYSLYWIAYCVNNIILFSTLIPIKWYRKLYRQYIKLWNRKEGNKIKSITVRNTSLILLNIFIVILDVFIIKFSMY